MATGLTSLRLNPHETRAIDLRKLRDAQMADFRQNKIPVGATDGSVNWVRLDNVAVSGRVVVISRRGGIGSGYDCGTCYCPPGFTSTSVSQDPANEPPIVPGQTCQHTATASFIDCNQVNHPYDVTTDSSWTSSQPSVATVNNTTQKGLVTGVSGGTPTITATHTDIKYKWNTVERMCDETPVTHSGSASCPVVPRFTVEYSSYIPVDHIPGPTTCLYTDVWITKTYMGDASRGTFRSKEFVNIVPDTHVSSGFSQDTGLTKNYGFGSPAVGSTLSGADEDAVPDDCYLWNRTGQALKNFSYDISFPSAHQGQVHYTGSASNPLESDSATITWDMRTVLDTTNPQAPTAYVNYNHTCYPSHQIKVNGQVISLYPAPQNDIGFLFDCLVRHVNKPTGQTSPVSVPTH